MARRAQVYRTFEKNPRFTITAIPAHLAQVMEDRRDAEMADAMEALLECGGPAVYTDAQC